MTSPTLEKTLMPLQLGKGVDQGVRPELSANDVLLTVENLFQDFSGAWVKRPGSSLLDYSDQDGGSMFGIKKIVSLNNGGVGMVSTSDLDTVRGLRMFHYEPGSSNWRQKCEAPEWSCTQYPVVSLSGGAPSADGQRIMDCAGCTNYWFVVTEAVKIDTAANVSALLVVYDRNSGLQCAEYDLGSVTGMPGTSATFGCRIAVVDDRYLHCYFTSGAVSKYFVYDTFGTPLPTSVNGFTINNWVAGASALLCDVIPVAGGSVAAYSTTILLTTNAGAQTSYNMAAIDGWTLIQSIDVSPNGNLYVAGLNAVAPAANVKLGVYSPANPGTVYVTAFNTGIAPGGTGLNYEVVCGRGRPTFSGDSVTIVDEANSTMLTATTRQVRVFYGTDPTIYGAAVLTQQSTMLGWTMLSKPFYNAITGFVYLHAGKADTSDVTAKSYQDLSTQAIVCLDGIKSVVGAKTGVAYTAFTSHRVSAIIDPFVGYKKSSEWSNTYAPTRYRPKSWNSGYEVAIAHSAKTASRSGSVIVTHMKAADIQNMYNTTPFGASTIMSGGMVASYDGRVVSEVGFADYPLCDAQAAAGAGVDAGLHFYMAVYRCTSATGETSYSRMFGPYSVTVAPGNNVINWSILPCSVNAKELGLLGGVANSGDPAVAVDLYRTVAGGKKLFLCASSQRAAIGGGGLATQQITLTSTTRFTFSDTMTDTVLQTQPEPHRQPLLQGSQLDRFTAPCASVVCQHKDRVFVARNNNVFYSSFFVDGEAPWFNAQFGFVVHGGRGPITGLASLDGRLIIFKSDCVFVVDGDGPSESGGNGSEYSPPTKLASEFGCIDQRSIVNVPAGIMFRSRRGIELLSRKLDVTWIGEKVRTTVDSFPVTLAGYVSRTNSQVRFLLASSVSANTQSAVGSTGAEVVYDTVMECWSVSRFRSSNDTTLGTALQGACTGYLNGKEAVFRCEGAYYSSIDSDSANPNGEKSLDNGAYYVPLKLETAWLKTSGPHERQRVYDAFILAKKDVNSNHALVVSLAYNYSDTYTQTRTWEPGEFNALALEEFCMQPQEQVVTAIRMKIEDQEPADTVTYPVGYGKGPEILGIAWQAAPKRPGPQLASGQSA